MSVEFFFFPPLGFTDENSKWLKPAKRKHSADDTGDDSDTQWEEEEEEESGQKAGDAFKEAKQSDDDEEEMVDDYGAMEDSEEDEDGSDGEEVRMMHLTPYFWYTVVCSGVLIDRRLIIIGRFPWKSM